MSATCKHPDCTSVYVYFSGLCGEHTPIGRPRREDDPTDVFSLGAQAAAAERAGARRLGNDLARRMDLNAQPADLA